MTGFGRAESESNGISFVVEVRSVNHRFLDVKIKMPRNLSGMEGSIKTLVKNTFRRGRIDLSVAVTGLKSSQDQIHVDWALVERHIALHQELCERFEHVKLGVSSETLLKAPGVMSSSERDEAQLAEEDLIDGVESALSKLVEMRQVEGVNMRAALLDLLAEIETSAGRLDKFAASQVEEQQSRLRERLSGLTQGLELELQQRLLIEVAILADKLDIREELDRLNSHFSQFREILLDESLDSCGRRLDFLCQEIFREINTTGSKCHMIEITQLTIEMKTLLERMREQVQNLE